MNPKLQKIIDSLRVKGEKYKIDLIDLVRQNKNPELNQWLDEHLKYYGELIPHVFFMEMTCALRDIFIKDSSSKHTVSLVKEICEFMEGLLDLDDEYLENLVGVSFVESLDVDKPYYVLIRKYFKPKTLQSARDYEKSWGLNYDK